MHTIHEYNKMIVHVKEHGEKVGKGNAKYKYAIWWYIADRLLKAKEYVGYVTTYCCEQVIDNLDRAVQAARILNLVGIVDADMKDEIVSFCEEDINAARAQICANAEEQYSYS